MLLEIIATFAAGLFAGAAIYIDLVEQPARNRLDIATALKEWRPSYKLLDPAIVDKNPDQARRLLSRWGRLHTVRSSMSLAVFVGFMLLL